MSGAELMSDGTHEGVLSLWTSLLKQPERNMLS
jgi:hypothetical protein